MDAGMTSAARATVLGLSLLAANAACAQALVDPTRPPTEVTSPGAAPASSGPRLHSVIISPARRLAVIDGDTVSVGGKIGDATVVQISETEVVLKRGDETERLTMFTGIEKRPRRPGGKK